MSYQYYDQGSQYGTGIPQYPSEQSRQYQRQMLPSQGGRRGPPPPQAGYGSNAQHRGPPPMRPVRPPQEQQYDYAPRPQAPPVPPQDSTENLYDGSAYGEPEYAEPQSDSWPLPAAPARPFAQQQGRNSPPSLPGSPRKPPQRPQRPDAPQTIVDQPRQPPPARVAPANQQYRQAPPLPPPVASHHGSGQWTGDGYSSPSSAYSQPQTSQQAFYQQGNFPPQVIKRPPLGPPPSARRGPASYYPQVAPVHPIAEETDSMRGSIRHASSVGGMTGHDSMRSYASSNAIPIGIPDYYLEQRDSGVPSLPGAERPISDAPVSVSEYGEGYDESPVDPIVDDGRVSRLDERNESPVSREEPSPEPAALVRQASYGRKSKPTLTTVKSGERMRRAMSGEGISTVPSQQRSVPNAEQPTTEALAKDAGLAKETAGRPSDVSEGSSYEELRFGNGNKALEAGGAAAVAAAAIAAPAYIHNRKKSKDKLSNRTDSSDALRSGTGLLDPSSSESEKSIKKKRSKELLGGGAARPSVPKQISRDRSPLAQEVDPRMSQILAGLEKGGALDPKDAGKLKQPSGGLSERAGKRRPPRLNVDAVRDAEARGSLTSLPDLIKRATRLASNLDRGKTASRLGMNWFDGADGSSDEKNADNRRSGSISDILASFPPPGLATPPGSREGDDRGGRLSNWPSNLRHSHLPSDSDAAGAMPERRRRRCCGMPLWLFLLLLVLLILLIAAAIIVPVVLIVVPRQNNSGNNGDMTNTALASCQSKLTCQNGGANIISSSGACQCVCSNGYTGSTCGTASGAGCTTTSVGSMNDATVGNAIPRLLTGAQSNFSVPLDGQTLLGLFSGAGLSCSSENALVTFNNNAGTKRSVEELVVRLEPTATVQKRQTATSSSGDGAATSNGIVYETGSPTTGSGSGSSTSSASSPSATSSSSSSTNAGASSTTQDFARVAVLYVLQASGQLNEAATAQQSLQSYFSKGTTSNGQAINPTNVKLGNGFTCDLSGHSISLANGTTVGES